MSKKVVTYKQVGENVLISKVDNSLLIKIDLDKELGPSSSGKTLVIGSTKGNKDLTNVLGVNCRIGINCYKYPPVKEVKE